MYKPYIHFKAKYSLFTLQVKHLQNSTLFAKAHFEHAFVRLLLYSQMYLAVQTRMKYRMIPSLTIMHPQKCEGICYN